jgi:multidrug resistance efflux pump
MCFTIDPRWLKLAVVSAQADVESKRHEMLMRQDAAHRRTLIKNAISSEDLQQTGSGERRGGQLSRRAGRAGSGRAESGARHRARAGLGYVTHLRLRPETTRRRETKVAIVDAHSFWVVGYFEETSCAIFASGMPRRWC